LYTKVKGRAIYQKWPHEIEAWVGELEGLAVADPGAVEAKVLNEAQGSLGVVESG
jgi:hypothetical protein